MNVLRIMLMITLLVYFSVFEQKFMLYFFSLLGIYFLLTEIVFYSSKITSSKKNLFLSYWCQPNDPQIFASIEVDITKLDKKLKEISKERGMKIGFTAYLTKVKAYLASNYKLLNTKIIFGTVTMIYLDNTQKFS